MKKGYDFQELVGELLKAFNPGAEVKIGEWTEGPDGRRDMDVAIVGEMDGKRKFLLIECKDYTYAKKSKRVGIPAVDAFDSKCTDLGVDIRVMASNSGFAEPAIRKCRRIGIIPIAALKTGDARAKAKILTTVYLRKLRHPGDMQTFYHPPDGIASPDLGPGVYGAVKLKGEGIDPWLVRQAMVFQAFHPWLTVPIRADFNFTHPQILTKGEIEFLISRIEVVFHWETKWLRQVVELDAGGAFYEYLHDRVTFTPGPNQYMWKGIDVRAAQLCSAPTREEYRFIGQPPPRGQAFDMGLVFFENGPAEQPKHPSAIDAAIRPEDLKSLFTDIPFDAIEWPPGS